MKPTDTSKITIVLDGVPRSAAAGSSEELPEAELPAYYPGDTIRGHVHVNVTADDHHVGVAVLYSGQYEFEVLHEGQLPPGAHSFPFECKCPEGELGLGRKNRDRQISARLVTKEPRPEFTADARFRLDAPPGTKPKMRAVSSSLGEVDTQQILDLLFFTTAIVGPNAWILLRFPFAEAIAEHGLWNLLYISCYLAWHILFMPKFIAEIRSMLARLAISKFEAHVEQRAGQNLIATLRVAASRDIEFVNVALTFDELVFTSGEGGHLHKDRNSRVVQQLGDRSVRARQFEGEFELEAPDPWIYGWSSSIGYRQVQWVVLVTVRPRARPQYQHRIVIPVEPDLIAAEDTPDGRAQAR